MQSQNGGSFRKPPRRALTTPTPPSSSSSNGTSGTANGVSLALIDTATYTSVVKSDILHVQHKLDKALKQLGVITHVATSMSPASTSTGSGRISPSLRRSSSFGPQTPLTVKDQIGEVMSHSGDFSALLGRYGTLEEAASASSLKLGLTELLSKKMAELENAALLLTAEHGSKPAGVGLPALKQSASPPVSTSSSPTNTPRLGPSSSSSSSLPPVATPSTSAPVVAPAAAATSVPPSSFSFLSQVIAEAASNSKNPLPTSSSLAEPVKKNVPPPQDVEMKDSTPATVDQPVPQTVDQAVDQRVDQRVDQAVDQTVKDVEMKD
eukprot:GILJ01009728.1.p1 GENE.GILJ01009728.1~~GILJ01009728.1.p1  ORF type:complete len:322 (-),score=77.67 GILJ01009728.1:202-1167(-)